MTTSTIEAQSPFAYASPTSGSARARRFAAALAHWVMPLAILARIGEYVRRQRDMRELYRLSDRELAEMRITRSQISEIYEPDFEQRRRT